MADSHAFTRFLLGWHGVFGAGRSGESLPSVIKRLQGYPIPYSDIEKFVLRARVRDYQYGDLDALCEKDIIAWQGFDRISQGDGYLSIYLKQMIPELARISAPSPGEMCAKLRSLLVQAPQGFDSLRVKVGGFPPQVLDSLWDMVWSGEVSNRRLIALQSLNAHTAKSRPMRGYGRSRLQAQISTPPGSRGEWYLITGPHRGFADTATRDAAWITQLLIRWGIVTREVFDAEHISGGMTRYLPILRELADQGKLVHGTFVKTLSSIQYALPLARELLQRESEQGSGKNDFVVLAATDPANPYGSIFPWTGRASTEGALKRTVGARVVLYKGRLIGYLSRDGHHLSAFVTHPGLTESLEDRLVHALCSLVDPNAPVLLKTINGRHPSQSTLETRLRAVGFSASQSGYIYRF